MLKFESHRSALKKKQRQRGGKGEGARRERGGFTPARAVSGLAELSPFMHCTDSTDDPEPLRAQDCSCFGTGNLASQEVPWAQAIWDNCSP